MSDLIKPIAITPGEPAGIGPDILLSWAQSNRTVPSVVISDPDLLTIRAQQLGLPITINNNPLGCTQAGHLSVLKVPGYSTVAAGIPSEKNGQWLLDTLNVAIDGCMSGAFSAMVTGPVNKAYINNSGTPFSGHTEYIADRTGTERVVMMLATKALRVALATTHLPLRDVADAITQQSLTKTLRILIDDLRNKFHIDTPRILVAGLNPHAGESGTMGREEIDIISPVMAQFDDATLVGPLPADTLFTPKVLANADAVLAMYHDQGLPVLKYQGFGEAVNITLGLPIIRTSVDHGTAFDMAGTGRADHGSLSSAFELAEIQVR